MSERLGVSVLMEGHEVVIWIEDRELHCSPRLALERSVGVNNVLGSAALVQCPNTRNLNPASGGLGDLLVINAQK